MSLDQYPKAIVREVIEKAISIIQENMNSESEEILGMREAVILLRDFQWSYCVYKMNHYEASETPHMIAYREGWERTHDMNPYIEGTDTHKQWDIGTSHFGQYWPTQYYLRLHKKAIGNTTGYNYRDAPIDDNKVEKYRDWKAKLSEIDVTKEGMPGPDKPTEDVLAHLVKELEYTGQQLTSVDEKRYHAKIESHIRMYLKHYIESLKNQN